MAITINGTTGVAGVDGSASTPAVQGSDTNTGVSFGTDTVNINTSGTTRATVDSAGRLLLGTTTEGHTSGDNLTIAATDGEVCGITLRSDTDEGGRIFFSDGTSGADEYRGVVGYDHASNHIYFSTDASERMRIDSSGKVGIGTTSPDGNLHVHKSSAGSVTADTSANLAVFETGEDQSGITILSPNTGKSNIYFGTTGTGGSYEAGIRYTHESHGTTADRRCMDFRGGGGDRMRINSAGRVMINTTTIEDSSSAQLAVVGAYPVVPIEVRQDTAQNHYAITFRNSNGHIGSVRMNGSTTNYDTSSDYRLKENVVAISDGITRLKTLKPSRFNFKADAKTTVDGFLAHEVTAVPEAINGTKDEVDSDNNPVYQAIDQSKLVPLLTAALQEEVAKREALEARVAALEAG